MKKLIVVTVAAIALIANMQAQNKKWSLKECRLCHTAQYRGETESKLD